MRKNFTVTQIIKDGKTIGYGGDQNGFQEIFSDWQDVEV